MVREVALRFLIGGVVVTAFSVLGDLFSPKSFAGLFGAAPSVALATLGLTVAAKGHAYAAAEARSMIAGGIAFFVYALSLCLAVMRYRMRVTRTTIALMPLWLVTAFGFWFVFFRGE